MEEKSVESLDANLCYDGFSLSLFEETGILLNIVFGVGFLTATFLKCLGWLWQVQL